MPIKVPNGYKSKDVIDRRNGEKPTLGDKARDTSIAVRNDWNAMKEAERRRSAAGQPAQQSPTQPKVGAAQVFGRQALPASPTAPDSTSPDKDDDETKQKKTGAAEIFGRRR